MKKKKKKKTSGPSKVRAGASEDFGSASESLLEESQEKIGISAELCLCGESVMDAEATCICGHEFKDHALRGVWRMCRACSCTNFELGIREDGE